MPETVGVREQVLNAIKKLGFDTKQLFDTTPFEDIGMDELDYVELKEEIEYRLSHKYPLFGFPDRQGGADLEHTLVAHVRYICFLTGLPE